MDHVKIRGRGAMEMNAIMTELSLPFQTRDK